MSDEPDAKPDKRPHAKLKRVAKDAGDVDVSDWELPRLDGALEEIIEPLEKALDQLQSSMTDRWHEVVRAAVAEVLEYAMTEDATVNFPIEWAPESDGMGGPAVTDAAIIRIAVPIGTEDNPHWEMSLADAVSDAISLQRKLDGSITNRAGLEALAAMFREQAARIDAALARAPTP